MQSTLKTTLSSCKVLAYSSNSPLPAIPDQSTNHIALAYQHAICLVIVNRYFSNVFLIDNPIAFAKNGGTAFPICTICFPFAP